MRDKYQLLLSNIHSFCTPIPLAWLKQGWDFALELPEKPDPVPAVGQTQGAGEQLAGPCPVPGLLSHSPLCATAGEIQAVSRPF